MILNGATSKQIERLLAKFLDYMEVAKYQPNTKTFLKTSILEKALELETNGVYDFILSGSSYSGGDLPNGNYAFSSATVLKRGSGINVILWGVTLSGGNYPPVMNFYNDTAWMGWKTLFTTDGGTLSDDITVDKGKTYLVDTRVGAKNVDCHIILLASSGGNIGLFDERNGKWVLKKDTNGNVTIADNTPFHTGNKPTGSYTGNGSAYQNIAVGGTGEFVMVSTDGSGTKSDFVIVSHNGYFGKVGGTVVQGGDMYTTSGGNLIIDGVTAFLTSGKQYRYQRL